MPSESRQRQDRDVGRPAAEPAPGPPVGAADTISFHGQENNKPFQCSDGRDFPTAVPLSGQNMGILDLFKFYYIVSKLAMP